MKITHLIVSFRIRDYRCTFVSSFVRDSFLSEAVTFCVCEKRDVVRDG